MTTGQIISFFVEVTLSKCSAEQMPDFFFGNRTVYTFFGYDKLLKIYIMINVIYDLCYYIV